MGDQKSMTRADILEAARHAVTKDRAATHGRPEDTFGLIAALWSARLGHDVSPAQVSIMLIDLKTARAWSNLGHMDNWVDIAGYAACGGELAGQADKPLIELGMQGIIPLDQAMDMVSSEAMVEAQAEIFETKQNFEAVAIPCGDRGLKDTRYRPWLGIDLCDSCEQKRAFNLMAGAETMAILDVRGEVNGGDSKAPAPEAQPKAERFKWTHEKDVALIGGVAAKVANGMSRRAAAHATAAELGLGEKACEVRATRDLGERVSVAIKAAEAAKMAAADLAGTMDSAKNKTDPQPLPKPAPIKKPASKLLVTPPHVALNIDVHLTECRAKGWTIEDDLRLFDLIISDGFGMGDVALDMGRDSKAIKDRYDLLTGIYRDANDKWCRKYGRDDVLAALRKMVEGGGK